MKRLLPLLLVFLALYWWSRDPTVELSSGDGSMGYVVEYTAGHGSGDRLPMLVALHGNGDTAANFYDTGLKQLKEPARIILLKGPQSFGGGDAWPWTSEQLDYHGNAVLEAIGILGAKFPTAGKPVLLGFSGGAGMAYHQALQYGRYYSLIVPVSDMLPPGVKSDVQPGRGAQVIAYHGQLDEVIAFVDGKLTADTLKKQGVEVTFSPFSGQHLGFFGTMNAPISEVIDQGLRDAQLQ